MTTISLDCTTIPAMLFLYYHLIEYFSAWNLEQKTSKWKWQRWGAVRIDCLQKCYEWVLGTKGYWNILIETDTRDWFSRQNNQVHVIVSVSSHLSQGKTRARQDKNKAREREKRTIMSDKLSNWTMDNLHVSSPLLSTAMAKRRLQCPQADQVCSNSFQNWQLKLRVCCEPEKETYYYVVNYKMH